MKLFGQKKRGDAKLAAVRVDNDHHDDDTAHSLGKDNRTSIPFPFGIAKNCRNKMKTLDPPTCTSSETSASTASCSSSKRSLLEDALEEQTTNNREDDPSYNLSSILRKLFANKTNKTVLLSDSQKDQVRQSIAADYTAILLLGEEAVAQQKSLAIHLRCASHVLNQFWDAQDMILTTKMADTAQEMLYLSIEEYIFPHIADQCFVLDDDVTPDLSAMAISWICQLETDLNRLAPSLVMRQEWFGERQRLLGHYLDRAVHHKMTIHLQEVLKLHSQDDIRRDVNGYLVSGLPEQVGYLYNQQLKAASECLPSKYQQDVLIACNEDLSSMIADWNLRISYEWRDMGSPYLCAIINDTSRLMEYCDERHEEYLTEAEYVEPSDDVTQNIADFALHTMQYLCQRVMHDLCDSEPILISVGSAAWEDPDEQSLVDRTIATFKDFFTDFESWLTRDYFFPKVLKSCFDLALQTYIESFFANTMDRTVNCPSAMASELERDYLRFVVYFNGDHFIEHHGHGGFYSQKDINDRMRVLQHMAAVVDPTNVPFNLSFEIKELLACFGEDGSSAILHLVGLRQSHGGIESMGWLKQIATAKQELSAENPVVLCNLPDLQNSKMLRKFRPPRYSVITRELSEDIIPYIESIVQLLRSQSRSLPGKISAKVGTNTIRLGSAWQAKQHKGHENLQEHKRPLTFIHSKEVAEKFICEDRQTAEEIMDENAIYFEGRVLAEF